MTNTELITAYLDNELNEADRTDFEERLQGDSELQQELALQKDVIEGIRMARKAELKQLLNNVPVGQTTFWSGGKIASVIAVVSLAVIGVIYFNTSDEPAAPAETQETIVTDNTSEVPQQPVDTETTAELPDKETSEPVETEETVTRDEPETIAESQPEDKRPVVAPSFDRAETEREEIIVPGGTILGEKVDTPTRTDVEIDRNSGTYTFHYAFEPGKLKLYGDFNNELYEILEFNSTEGRNWFLKYEDKYYFLDNSTNEIRPLTEISDAQLLNRLRNVE